MIQTQNSNISLITQINSGNLLGAITALTSDLTKSVAESVPVKQLINHGAKVNQIEAALAILIAKFAKMLSVGGNLKEGHSIEIAKMLIEEYPTSSLDDFQIMLSRGVRGRYGEIFRFDVAVIFGWMSDYMEEWAEEKERQLAKEKGKQKTTIEEFKEVEPEKVDAMLNELLSKLKDEKDGMKSVPQLTPQEIKKEGQIEPPRKKAHSYIPNPSNVIMHHKKMEWIRLYTESDGGDGFKIKDGAPTFEEWTKQQTI